MAEALKETNYKWLGNIPDSWDMVRVKDGFYQKKGKARQMDPIVLSLARDGVKVRDITTNEGQLAESYFNYNPVEPGDMMINPMDLQSGANCSLSRVSGVISPAYVNLRHKKGYEPRYYDYYFKYQYWSFAFFTYGKGVSFDNRWTLNNETLMKYPLIAPPYCEQVIIADFLDEKCTEIAKLSEDIQKQIDILNDYKKAVITRAVTKGLDLNAEMKDSDIEWCVKIPKHWIEKPNKYIMSKRKDICAHYDGGDILSLTMRGVIVRDLDGGGKMPTSFDGYQYLYPGNLLMCLFDYDVTPRCIGMIKDKGLTSPAYSQFVLKNGNSQRYYFYYYLMIDYTKELLHLAKNLRHSFNEEQIGSIKAPVPPIEEQNKIADYLDDICSKIDTSIEVKEAQLSKITDYKKSIIYEYVTGKKRVV